MPKNRQLTEALIGYFFLFWAASVLAAGNAFEEGIKEITALVALGVCVMAGGGGVAGTLSKVANPEHPIKNVAVEMLKDLAGSIVFGWLVYFFTTWAPFWAQAGLIIMAGFGGSKALDRFVDSQLGPMLGGITERIFGKSAAKDETP